MGALFRFGSRRVGVPGRWIQGSREKEGGALNTRPLTKRQIGRLERLPEHHEVVSTDVRPPIIRGPRGQLLRLQQNGHLEGLVERVRSYLQVNG